jgi:hypothetical protein
MLQEFATGQKGPVRSYQRGSEEKLTCLEPRIEPCSFSPQSVINSATVLNCVTSRHCAMFWCRLCQCQYGVSAWLSTMCSTGLPIHDITVADRTASCRLGIELFTVCMA